MNCVYWKRVIKKETRLELHVSFKSSRNELLLIPPSHDDCIDLHGVRMNFVIWNAGQKEPNSTSGCDEDPKRCDEDSKQTLLENKCLGPISL